LDVVSIDLPQALGILKLQDLRLRILILPLCALKQIGAFLFPSHHRGF
jgi:hypothetical protein